MAQFMGPDSLAGRALSLGGALGCVRWRDDLQHACDARGRDPRCERHHRTRRRSLEMYAACVSEVDGIRLLTPETVAKVSETQTSGADQVLMLESTFGLGFMTPGIMTPMLGPSSFGHAGAAAQSASATPTAASRSAT